MSSSLAARIAAFLIVGLGVVTRALAYEVGTHQVINRAAASFSTADIRLRTDLGISNGLGQVVSDPVTAKPIIDWIGYGGVREDDPLRFLNHFHHPLRSPWRTAGLTDRFDGRSSIVWGQDRTQGAAWQNARDSFFAALTRPARGEREEQWATTFRTLGQLMHLIADASVPAHARNDNHGLLGDPYEEWVEAQAQAGADQFVATFAAAPGARTLRS